MYKTHHYSQTKFTSFSARKQEQVILEMLSALETNLDKREFISELLTHMKECLNWLHPEANPAFFIIKDVVMNEQSPQLIVRTVAPILDAYGINPRDDELVICKYDGNNQKSGIKVPYPLYLVLDNLRSAYNVGAIIRTAECLQVQKIWFCGITPTPDHPKIVKTAMGTASFLQWEQSEDTLHVVRCIQEDNIPVIALETLKTAINLSDYQPNKPVALILGNEALGISEEVLAIVDMVISIPVFGWKNSLNVSSAFAIAGYWLSGCLHRKVI